MNTSHFVPAETPSYKRAYHAAARDVSIGYSGDWSKDHPIEGDGLCPQIYQYLHKRVAGRDETTLNSVVIPETVVFNHNFPRAWFAYDEENNEILKRPGHMLDAQTMYDHFRHGEGGKPRDGDAQGGMGGVAGAAVGAAADSADEVIAVFYHEAARTDDLWAAMRQSAPRSSSTPDADAAATDPAAAYDVRAEAETGGRRLRRSSRRGRSRSSAASHNAVGGVARRSRSRSGRVPVTSGDGAKAALLTPAVKNELLSYVEYFTAAELHAFLFTRPRKPDGVLQKFIVPKGDGRSRRNFCYQVLWAPLLTVVRRRTNVHRLEDHAVPPVARLSTFDGPLYHSEESLVTDDTKKQLEAVGAALSEHFYVTEGRRLARLLLYLTRDVRGRLTLLWCGGARVAADALNRRRHRVPLALTTRLEVVNGVGATVDQLAARRRRQKQLLALDYALFQVSHDIEFTLAVNASHRRQATALGLQGLPEGYGASRGGRGGGPRDPRLQRSHPLYESFHRICDVDDLDRPVQELGQGLPAHAGAGEADGWDEASAELSHSGLDGAAVKEELAALAMDLWYAVYSTTLAEDPRVMPTARAEVAEPLIAALYPEELAQLLTLIGVRPVEGIPDTTSSSRPPVAAAAAGVAAPVPTVGSSGLYVSVPSWIVQSGRRVDRPSAQVREEVVEFFNRLFEEREDEITRVCLDEMPAYFS